MDNTTGEEEVKTVKVVIQQCLSARLKPPRPDEQTDEDFGPDRSIGAGMVVFVCFSKGAAEGAAIRAAGAVARLRLCEPPPPPEGDTFPEVQVDALPEVEKEKSGRKVTRNKRMSVLEGRGDVLVVPQFTLGAKLKGNNSLQYHGNVDKADGERLFKAFCAALEALVEEDDPKEVPQGSQGSLRPRVVGGVYGARQRLAMDTDGPYTHTLQL